MELVMNKITYYFNKWFGIQKDPKLLSSKQIWYGRVNAWKDLKITEKDIIRCAKEGVAGYMIELAGDYPNNPEAWKDPWVEDIEKKYKKLVKMCRAAGLWLFVSIVNDNMGQGKYGDTSPKLDNVLIMAQTLAMIVKKNGTSNVIVQPVAETQTNAGRIFEKYCRNELCNFPLVYNGSGGFPSGTGGFNYRAVHPSTTITVCPSDALVISDHSKIIRELALLGSFNASINPGKAHIWADTVFNKSKCSIMGYYAFQRIQYDKDTISVLGEIANSYENR